MVGEASDLATAVELEPEDLPRQGMLGVLWVGVGGDQDPAGMLAGGDAAEVGDEPVPAEKCPGNDRRPVRRVAVPQQDLFCPSKRRALARGEPLGRLGHASSSTWLPLVAS